MTELIIAIAAVILSGIAFKVGRGTSKTAASPKAWKDLAIWHSNAYGLDWRLILAIIEVESNGNPEAVGSANELGLMQITPIVVTEYNREVGSNLKHSMMTAPTTNVKVGVWYLARLRDHYGISNVRDMLRAYNAGPTRILQGNSTISQSYADKVLSAQTKY